MTPDERSRKAYEKAQRLYREAEAAGLRGEPIPDEIRDLRESKSRLAVWSVGGRPFRWEEIRGSIPPSFIEAYERGRDRARIERLHFSESD